MNKVIIPVIVAVLFASPFTINSAFAEVLGGQVDGCTSGGGFNCTPGQFVELDSTSSFSVGADNYDDFNLYAFNENQNLSIPVSNPIQVDILTNNPTGGSLSGIVASHYVFYDPPGTTFNTSAIEGCVEFDSAVVGIITSKVNLDTTDLLLENSNIEYLSADLRGLESGDIVNIDENNPNAICLDLRASTPGDYVRVLTNFSIENAHPGKAQRADVNNFLTYGNLDSSTINLVDNTFSLILGYGDIIPDSFSATLNGVDITSQFDPTGNAEIVLLTGLDSSRNVLKLSVDGYRDDTRTATDTDRIVLLSP